MLRHVSSGKPPGLRAAWASSVDYVSADVFDAAALANALAGAAAVVSCIGGFGSNDAMRRINGDANAAAVAAARSAGVPRFVFVSVHRYNLPDLITGAIGYFEGKRAAERAVLASYDTAGAILQPGFIFGDRLVGATTLPLGAVGAPLERALASAREGPLGGVLRALAALPASDVLLAPPVDVDAVAAAALRCAAAGPDGAEAASGVFDIDGINALAAAAAAARA
jgi:nucleoside-diphosphate-sugar epimerase